MGRRSVGANVTGYVPVPDALLEVLLHDDHEGRPRAEIVTSCRYLAAKLHELQQQHAVTAATAEALLDGIARHYNPRSECLENLDLSNVFSERMRLRDALAGRPYSGRQTTAEHEGVR